MLRWKRSILPVVAGLRGWVNKCSIPLSRQIAIKEHLDRRMVEPTGEYLAVVGQDLLGCPIGQPVLPRSPSQTARVRSRAINRAHTHIRE